MSIKEDILNEIEFTAQVVGIDNERATQKVRDIGRR